jgi:uncharacterized membrane protein YccC
MSTAFKVLLGAAIGIAGGFVFLALVTELALRIAGAR